jgi:phage terminase large subunit-like protein
VYSDPVVDAWIEAALDDSTGYHPSDNPADYLESEFIIPETGQPIILHPEQRQVLDAMSARDADGHFQYMTWLYSAPKKSGKTAIGAGLALWQAERIPNGEIYIVGNDLKQADNRMNQAIRYCVQHNPRMTDWRIIRNTIYCANGTRIEAVPVDPSGEAGANPTGIFWTEAWGARQKKHQEMWSEMVLSPTRSGDTFKFVESYAGFRGESVILERLFDSVVKPEYALTGLPECYAHGPLFAYWCTRRIMPWMHDAQAKRYYHQEEIDKHPDEFRRVHGNEWVDSTARFVPGEWWDVCQQELPPMKDNQGWIIGVDAAVTSDCFAIVGVTRHGEELAIRYCQIWTPPPNGEIDFTQPEAELRRLCQEYHVLQIAYDKTELQDMAQRLRRDKVTWLKKFDQGNARASADKQLYDCIRDRRIMYWQEPDLTEHIKNADADINKHENRMRLIKRAEHLKIDAAVALSMACSEALRLNL